MKPVRSVKQLNKNAAGDCGVIKRWTTRSGNRRDSIEWNGIETADVNVQNEIARAFVSHNVRIIAYVLPYNFNTTKEECPTKRV